MAVDWQRLGRVVRQARIANGFTTQAAFARHIGLDPKTVGRIETAARASYDERTLAAIEDGLGWQRGSAAAVLQGRRPALAPDPDWTALRDAWVRLPPERRRIVRRLAEDLEQLP